MKRLALILSVLLIDGFSAQAISEEAPTSKAKYAKVRGVLVDKTAEPVRNAFLWLLIPSEGTGWVEIQKPNIKTGTDDKGAFIFENVPPGRYILATSSGIPSSLPSVFIRNEQGTTVIFEFEEKQVYDLGIIRIK